MTTLITGNFQQQNAAERALSALAGAGFTDGQMTTFFVNPPGQHNLYPIGGDEDESKGTEDAAVGTVAGAAVGGTIGVAVGLATLPVLGPGAAVAATGVGAYVGSFYGALSNTDEQCGPAKSSVRKDLRHNEPPRKSGLLVAVCAPESAQQDSVIRILRAHGATDIDRPEGTIVAGEWTDFDPLTPLHLVAG